MSMWRRWVAMLARREPATPLALFRIAVGLVILGTMTDMIAADVVAAVWYPPEDGGIRALVESHWLVQALGGASARTTDALLTTTMLSAAALVVGLGSRLAALVALQCSLALFSLHPGSGGGHDRLIANALWLLVLAPADVTLSLRSRLSAGTWCNSTPVPAWVRYLAIYQIALVYTCTGVQKLGADWWPWGGLDAVYFSLLTPSWQRFEPVAWVAWIFPLTQVGTALTVLWESTWMLVPLHLYFRATRTRPGRLRAVLNRLNARSVYALVGVMLHGGIWVTMNVGPFSWITCSYYLCLWHHDEYRQAARRVRGRFLGFS